MLSRDVVELENENHRLKNALSELGKKLDETDWVKPKCCKFCKNYIQHYAKDSRGYHEIYSGHCTSGMPIKKGGKKAPFPNDLCPYYEFGTREMKYC